MKRKNPCHYTECSTFCRMKYKIDEFGSIPWHFTELMKPPSGYKRKPGRFVLPKDLYKQSIERIKAYRKHENN